MNIENKILIGLFWVLLSSCHIFRDNPPAPPSTVFEFDFNTTDSGWTAGFARYPERLGVNPSHLVVESGWQTIPHPLSGKGFKLSGRNRLRGHKLNLLMYIKYKLTGLKPNTEYKLFFKVLFASNAPKGKCWSRWLNSWRSPGDSVHLKAGASPIEPISQVNQQQRYYHLNWNVGEKGKGGNDAVVLGNISNSQTINSQTQCPSRGSIPWGYELIGRNNINTPFTATSNENGGIWILLATDSGYPGRTTIYFNNIRITATEISRSLTAPQ